MQAIPVTCIGVDELSHVLGIHSTICRVFLAEARRRMPRAKFCIVNERARITFSRSGGGTGAIAYMMDRENGYTRIYSGHDRLWELIPETGLTNRAAANRATDLYGAEIVSDRILPARLSRRMTDFYHKHGIVIHG